MSNPSLADLVGTALYILTALASTWAVTVDRKRSRTPGSAAAHWWAVAALFVGMAAWRFFGAEGRVQGFLRDQLRADGAYDDRYAAQGPLAAVLVVALTIIGAIAAWRWIRLPRHRAWSMAGALGLLGYSLVRLVSYHPIDRLIYAGVGPLRLNHLIEFGFIALVFYGIYLMTSNRQAARRSRRSAW